MKTKALIIQIVVALITAGIVAGLYYKSPVINNLAISLTVYSILFTVMAFSFYKHYKNFGYGILYGFAGSIGIVIVLLINQLFEKL